MKRKRKLSIRIAFFFFFFQHLVFSFCALHAENAIPVPKVLVSIKPLHSLVAGVMEGVGQPELLVGGSSSPHNFSLRPSDARAISQAALLVWIGPGFETFLEKSMQNSGEKLVSLVLSKALSEKLLPSDPHHQCEHSDHEHEEHAPDYHFWLDPKLAQKTLFLVAEELGKLDAFHKELYLANAKTMAEKLDLLDEEIRKKLQPVQEVPFLVFHPAYQYFEKAYHLNQVGVIALDPERQPGARRVVEIRKQIRELKVQCVFSEPQFESRLVETVIEGTPARRGILDPLGADLDENSEMYFTLLKTLAENLLKGLSGKSS